MDCEAVDIRNLQDSWNDLLKYPRLDSRMLQYSTVRIIIIDKSDKIWHDILLPYESNSFSSLHWQELSPSDNIQIPPLNEYNNLKKTAMRLALDSNNMALSTPNPHNFFGRSLLCIADLRPAKIIPTHIETFMFFYNISDYDDLFTEGLEMNDFKARESLITPSRFRRS